MAKTIAEYTVQIGGEIQQGAINALVAALADKMLRVEQLEAEIAELKKPSDK